MFTVSIAATIMATALAATPGDVLRVERKEDKRGRDAVYQRLRTTKVDFYADDLSITSVADWMTLVAGEGIHFLYLGADRGTPTEPTVNLKLDQKTMTQVMGILSDVTELAFVYRNGIVMIKPEEEVREETELKVYDLRAATATLKCFVGPTIGGLHPSGYEPDEVEEAEYDAGTISGLTMEDIEQVVRDNVSSGLWDAEGVSLAAVGGLLVVRQTERGHAQVRSTLRAIGVSSL